MRPENAHFLRRSWFPAAAALLVASSLGIEACHRPKATAQAPTPLAQANEVDRAAAPEATQRHWTYLNRIRQNDAFNSSIQRTLLADHSQLGVVLSSSVASERVPTVMREVMMEMAKEFRQEDVTLIVYAASAPPHKIGIAHLDGQTGKTTYSPGK